MATVTFDSLVNNIAPQVPGCPTAVISATVRKIVIDLCERAKIWRVTITPVAVTSGVYIYTFTSPIANTEISDIITPRLYLTSAATFKKLELTTGERVIELYPQWPSLVNLQEPKYLLKDETNMYLCPVPGTADTYTINAVATIRPSQIATTWDSNLASQYQREIYHGALHELMMIPDRVWTDDNKSLYHGKQWAFLLNSARARANKGFGRANINVAMRPWG